MKSTLITALFSPDKTRTAPGTGKKEQTSAPHWDKARRKHLCTEERNSGLVLERTGRRQGQRAGSLSPGGGQMVISIFYLGEALSPCKSSPVGGCSKDHSRSAARLGLCTCRPWAFTKHTSPVPSPVGARLRVGWAPYPTFFLSTRDPTRQTFFMLLERTRRQRHQGDRAER